MKKKTEELTNEFYRITQNVYKDVNPNGQPGAGASEDKKDDGDDTIDGDYEVVD